MKVKKRTLKNGVQTKAKDYNVSNCTVCGSKLFSMEYLYNNGKCNPCLRNGNRE